MATCGEIFSGEWEAEEELFTSLARFIAEALEKDAAQYESECNKFLGKTDWGGLLDLVGSDVPGLITQLTTGATEGEEEEAESQAATVNGIVSVLIGICLKITQTEDRTKYWTKLAQMVAPADGVSTCATTRLQLLLDIFNAIPSNAPRASFSVFRIIVDFAAANELVTTASAQLRTVEARAESWGLKDAERRELYVKLARALKGADDASMTFEFITKYLALFTEGDKETQTAFPLAVEAAVIAIQDPVQYDCMELLRLPAVAALAEAGGKEAATHRLLQIFGSEKLCSYQEFAKSNQSAVAELGLDNDDCVNKMRILSLVNLATENAEIPYSTIAETLEIQIDEVESWVIRVSRAGLVKTRMDQLRQVVVVARTKVRVFHNNDWAALGTQVGAWKDSLAKLQAMIRQARETDEEN